MSLQNFRSYQLAVALYRKCRSVPLPSHLKDQLLRAGSSIVLNLGEGSARATRKDRVRFYTMAFASLREVQAIADIEDSLTPLRLELDTLAAHLYKLVHH